MQNGPSIEGVGQIHISVADVDRSVEFYQGVLGLDLLFRVDEQSMAFFDCGGVRLYLGRPEEGGVRSSPLIYYRVQDLDAACSRIEASGGQITEAPHLVHRDAHIELRMAGLRDPDGHPLCLMSESAPRDG